MQIQNHWIKGWRIETVLLLCAILFVGVHFAQLSIVMPQERRNHAFVFAIWVLCVILGKVLLDWRLPHRDRGLFSLAMFLCGWGLLILERLTPTLALRQSIWLILALCAMCFVVMMPVPQRWLRQGICGMIAGVFALVILTFFVGVHPSLPRGAPALWLSLDRLFIQPSELLKLALIVFFALQIRASGLPKWYRIMPIWGIGIGLLLWQRDFGVALLFGITLFQLAYLVGVHWQILGIMTLIFGLFAVFAYVALPIVRLRVDIWRNPSIDIRGSSYQLVQSLQAFSGGGLAGRGFGAGNPARIPLSHSDFIFSAIAEEWGFIGVIVILLCIGLITWRSLMIGHRQISPHRRLLAYGIAVMCISQNMMIMGGALGMLPLTGMPFTFVSYGGSSLLVSMMMIGVLLRLSANTSPVPHFSDRIVWLQWGMMGILVLIAGVAFYWAFLSRQ